MAAGAVGRPGSLPVAGEAKDVKGLFWGRRLDPDAVAVTAAPAFDAAVVADAAVGFALLVGHMAEGDRSLGGGELDFLRPEIPLRRHGKKQAKG